MPRWLLDAAFAALALLSEIRRRRSLSTARLPSTNILASYNQPNIKPALLKRYFLQTRHGHLLYRYSDIAGEKAPLLILLHNQKRSSDQFCEFIQLCCTRFRCVAPDLLGHGESDKPDTELLVEDYADHVVSLMDTLRAEKAFILGDSLGAFVAAHLAATYPTRVQRAVLVNVDFTSRFLRGLQKSITRKRCTERINIHDAWEANRAAESRELNYRCTMDRLRLWGFESFGERAMVHYWQQFLQTAERITCPIMLLWGRENLRKGEATRLTWGKDGTPVERAIPHAEVVYLKGHVYMLERFADLVFARIVPFLRERPGSALVHFPESQCSTAMPVR